MPKVTKYVTTEYTISLAKEEATYLMNICQNYLFENNREEPDMEKRIRRAVFESLRNELQD